MTGILISVITQVILLTGQEPDEVATTLNRIIDGAQHSFFMMIAGIVMWFALEWSIHIEQRKKKGVTFWQDQKDEIVITLIGGLIFLVWDDETIQAYYDIMNKEGHHELKPYYYLLVGPAVERLVWLYKKLKGVNGK